MLKAKPHQHCTHGCCKLALQFDVLQVCTHLKLVVNDARGHKHQARVALQHVHHSVARLPKE